MSCGRTPAGHVTRCSPPSLKGSSEPCGYRSPSRSTCCIGPQRWIKMGLCSFVLISTATTSCWMRLCTRGAVKGEKAKRRKGEKVKRRKEKGTRERHVLKQSSSTLHFAPCTLHLSPCSFTVPRACPRRWPIAFPHCPQPRRP